MFENTNNRTELEQLGEFGLIRHIASNVELKQPSTVKGIGDDCAVIDRGEYYELVTTDLLLEGVHFDLAYSPLKHLGYKAVMVNLSDIYAMNGKPRQILTSLGLSTGFRWRLLRNCMPACCWHARSTELIWLEATPPLRAQDL
jgi:thiamine-monophosphate kinase